MMHANGNSAVNPILWTDLRAQRRRQAVRRALTLVLAVVSGLAMGVAFMGWR